MDIQAQLQNYVNTLPERATPVLWSLVTAAAIVFLGRMVAKMITAALRKVLERSKTDPTLISFLSHLLYSLLLALVVIAALERLGVNTTSFAAVIAAGGLAIGLALSGSLANFAAGVMLILFHHFRVGDVIEAGGQKGTVEELQIFWTVMRAEDGTKIVCPNGAISGGVIKVFKKP
ncbi:MAG TPA: mechanosensitive ion channel domain-containing protein [bacterium]|nr:mechanosensitive ion channel domain-containing protein [bacterium]